MIAAALAGLVLHLHNIVPVLGMITLRKGRSFWASWGESYALEIFVEGMLLSLGLLAALLVVQATWGLALMILPAFAAYQALKHTVESAARKGMLAEELEHRLAEEFRGWESVSQNNPYHHSPTAIDSPSMESQRRPLLRSALR